MGALTTLLLAGVPMAPSLHTRLIALIVVEAVLAVVVVASYFKYRQLKAVSTDEWFAGRDKQASPRVQRMMEESREQWEAERAEADRLGWLDDYDGSETDLSDMPTRD